MREADIICTVCPMGCRIRVTGEGTEIASVEGFSCPRGEKYARSEFVCPVRTLTTTVLVLGSTEPTLPVRTSAPIPKAQLFACMELVRKLCFTAPVSAGQVLIADIGGTGADLVACTDREKI